MSCISCRGVSRQIRPMRFTQDHAGHVLALSVGRIGIRRQKQRDVVLACGIGGFEGEDDLGIECGDALPCETRCGVETYPVHAGQFAAGLFAYPTVVVRAAVSTRPPMRG